MDRLSEAGGFGCECFRVKHETFALPRGLFSAELSKLCLFTKLVEKNWVLLDGHEWGLNMSFEYCIRDLSVFRPSFPDQSDAPLLLAQIKNSTNIISINVNFSKAKAISEPGQLHDKRY